MKATKRISNFKKRLKLAYNILFKHRHYIFIPVSHELFTEVVSHEFLDTDLSGEVSMKYYGMQKHQCYDIVRYAANGVDFVEHTASKALFHAKVDERNSS